LSDDPVDSDTEGEAVEGDGDIDSDINADADINHLNADNAKYKGDFVDGVEPSQPESSEKGESEGQLASNEQGKEVEPNQADQNESNAEVDSEQFDPNESENIEVQNEFDPNVPDAEGNPDEFNPNIGGERYESDFDPNAPEGNVEQEEFEPNEADEEGKPDQFNPNEGRENYEGNEYDQYEMEGDDKSNYDPENFEQEEHSGGFYENRYAESMNTILLSENLIYAYLQEYIKLMGEKENEGMEQGEEAEVEQSKEDFSELEKFLEEERERIRLEQEQVDLDEVIEPDPEPEPIANEEEVEQEQEEEVGTQENISEEKISNNEEEVENLEMELEEDLQSALPNENIESGKFEEIKEKNEEPQEKLEEREILKLNDDENEKYEQHQSETQFESDHEIYPEPIVHKKELEFIRVEHEEKEEHEEFIKEELEVHHEINLSETEVLTIEQEEELEQDNTSSYKEKERDIEEFEDHQQELEEILEQTRKIEQERENSDKSIEVKNYEKAKKLYSQETGKRPIYANKETKGFKEWLEQSSESGEKLKGEQSREQNVEQENEEEWTAFLKNWLKNESGEEVSLEMKNEVKQIIEKYNDLDELTTRFQELYKQEQLNQLSQSEKMELRALVKTLQKTEPENIVLFTNLRALKRYLNHQKPDVVSDKTLINRTLNHLFTRLSPVKQLNNILKAQKLEEQKETQPEWVKFCNVVVKNIKKRIGIYHDDYLEYSTYLKNNDINSDKIIKILTSKAWINKFLEKSNISKTKSNYNRARNCLIVLSTALLKCSEYKSLKNYLKESFNLKETSVYRYIKNYIPLLKKLNLNVNINSWLPLQQGSPISYDDCEVLGEEKNCTLITTQEEFISLIESRGEGIYPVHIPLKWFCNEHGIFKSSYNTLKASVDGCQLCGHNAITYNDCKILGEEKNCTLMTTQEEFISLIESRGEGIFPVHIPLKWFCEEHGTFMRNYNTLKASVVGCQICALGGITYNDCETLANKRNYIFKLTKRQFISLIENREKNISPAKLIFEWFCPEHNVNFLRSYRKMRFSIGCPICFKKHLLIGIYIHPIIEYYSLKLLRSKFCQCSHEEYITSGKKYHIDLLINRNKNFITNIEKIQNIVQFPSIIRKITVDLTLSTNIQYILSKCQKSYQDDKSFLIIVLLLHDKKEENYKNYTKNERNKHIREIQQIVRKIHQEINDNSNILYKKHIKVITFDEYLAFLGLSNDIVSNKSLSNLDKLILKNFIKYRKLSINAINSDLKFKVLYDEYMKFSQFLNKNK